MTSGLVTVGPPLLGMAVWINSPIAENTKKATFLERRGIGIPAGIVVLLHIQSSIGIVSSVRSLRPTVIVVLSEQ